MPPPLPHFGNFFSDVLIRGVSSYTLNLSFVITEHLKLVSGQKNFPTAHGTPPKLGGQLIFCSVFASKLITILHSPKADEIFLLKSKAKDPKSKSKKLKLTLNFHLQKELEVQLKNWRSQSDFTAERQKMQSLVF